MLSGDGFLVRIYPILGHLSRAQIKGIAAIAERFGNGNMDLTNRGGLQLRGVARGNFEGLIEAVDRLKLLKTEPTHSKVICSPFWKDRARYEKVINEVNLYLSKFPSLPKKFLISLDLERQASLGSIPADIKVEAFRGNKYILRPNGNLAGLLVSLNQLPELIFKMTQWLVDYYYPITRGRRFENDFCEGVEFPSFGFDRVEQIHKIQTPQIGNCMDSFIVGVPFGALSAKTLYDIADLGSGMRLTPWRRLILENAQGIEHPELISDADDPRLWISACVGKPSCSQGKVKTRNLAELIAKNVKFYPNQPSLNDLEMRVHVSGCSKGCANPGKAILTLVGLDNENFNMIFNGSSLDKPNHFDVKKSSILTDINKVFGKR